MIVFTVTTWHASFHFWLFMLQSILIYRYNVQKLIVVRTEDDSTATSCSHFCCLAALLIRRGHIRVDRNKTHSLTDIWADGWCNQHCQFVIRLVTVTTKLPQIQLPWKEHWYVKETRCAAILVLVDDTCYLGVYLSLLSLTDFNLTSSKYDRKNIYICMVYFW